MIPYTINTGEKTFSIEPNLFPRVDMANPPSADIKAGAAYCEDENALLFLMRSRRFSTGAPMNILGGILTDLEDIRLDPIGSIYEGFKSLHGEQNYFEGSVVLANSDVFFMRLFRQSSEILFGLFVGKNYNTLEDIDDFKVRFTKSLDVETGIVHNDFVTAIGNSLLQFEKVKLPEIESHPA